MEKYKISIIIPIYNCGKYLNRCFDSITKQKYSNLEILLIDDGSTDNSGKLCDIQHEKDSRFLVIHKENSGQSDCRNIGTAKSTGDFIMYIDADDEFVGEVFSELIEIYIKYKSDLIFYKNNVVIDETKRINSNYKGEIIEFDSWKSAYEYSLVTSKMSCCLWSRMYSDKLAKKVKLIDGLLCEDIESTHRFISSANKVVLVNKIYYNYYIRSDSTMGNKKQTHMYDIFKVAKIVYKFEIKNFSNTKYMKYINSKYINNSLKSFSFLYYSDNSKFKEDAIKCIARELNEFSIFMNMKFKARASLTLFKLNKKLLAKYVIKYGNR